MKRFQFRLQKLRKLREDLKKRAQRKFALAKLREQEETRKLVLLQQEVSQRRRDARMSRTNRVYPSRLKASVDYITQLEFLISHQKAKVAECARFSEDCRRELENASKEVKKFERLEDIRREQYMHEMELLLQKDNDEVASQVGRRRSAAE